MASIMVLCTTNIPPKIIEDFLTQSTRARTAVNDWLIIQEPNQELCKEWDEHNAKAPTEPFQTGFESASFESLTKFVSERAKKPDAQNWVSGSMFAVLDERSIRDGTVLISRRRDVIPPEVTEGNWVEEKKVTTWKQWRVKFLTAWFLTSVLDTKPGLYIEGFKDTAEEYIDEDGVLQMLWIERDKREFPDLDPAEQGSPVL